MKLYWMRKNKTVLYLAFLGYLTASPVPLLGQDEDPDAVEPKVLDEIVAKINSEIITLTELNNNLQQLRMEVEGRMDDPSAQDEAFARQKRLLLRTMIQNRIMVQKAEEMGITADIDLDVSAYLEEMRKEAGIPSLDVLDQYFRERGSSLTDYREMVKEQMITRSLIQQFVYSKITLLTPEVEAYYEEHKGEFLVPAEVELAEILFLTEGKDPSSVREEAEEVLSRLKTGETFEQLAEEYSDGPTASQGGNIGSFKQGSMNAALEEVAFNQEVGSFSGIIESDFGFQIVKVVDRKEREVQPLQEVRPQIAEVLYQKKAAPELREFIEQLIDESYIYITPKYAEEYDTEGLS